MRRRIVRLAAAAAAAFLLAEALCRVAGVTDFPLYDVDAEIGYLPKADQSGRFLHRNAWVFNEKHMGVVGWDPSHHPNLMLIGNSVVLGGLPYDESQELAALVEHRLGAPYRVYPIATGGWTNLNEMAYLDRNPDVVAAADFFVWEVMTDDFEGLRQWTGDLLWPRRRPLLASLYTFERYVLPMLMPQGPAAASPPARRNPAALARFADRLQTLKDRGAILVYPRQSDLEAASAGKEWFAERPFIEALCAKYDLVLIDVAADGRWNERSYRDGQHPTVQGNEVLADLIVSRLAKLLGKRAQATENELPQPHEEAALGLRTWK